MARETARARRAIRLATVTAVTRVGEDLLGEAQRRAPVEEGTLRASGDLDIVASRSAVRARVSFNTIYAARQHEELDWDHPKGGQAKYLESVLHERTPRYAAIVAAAIRRAL